MRAGEIPAGFTGYVISPAAYRVLPDWLQGYWDSTMASGGARIPISSAFSVVHP
jgi:hypothetical protein